MLFQQELTKQALSADPIFNAFENYRGTIFDLDQAIEVDRSGLAAAEKTIVSALTQQGVDAGDRVVMAVSNGPQFVATLVAILARGGSPLLLHVDTPPAELARVAKQRAARAVVCDNWSPKELEQVEFDTHVVSSSPSWLKLVIARPDAAVGESLVEYPQLPGVPLHPTSGTTGTPKLAARPGPVAIAEADHYIETMGIDDGDSILCTIPMSHAYAYGVAVMVSLVSGANLATLKRFDPKRLAQAIDETPVTLLPVAPAMLDLLLLAAPDCLSKGIRRVTSAGAPLPVRTSERAKEASGVIVRPLYGTTETGGIAVCPDGLQLNGTCVGPAMQGVETRLEPTDGGTELGEDGMGRLFIRSSSNMIGYLQPDGLDQSILQDGWFETGDLARIGDDGAIYLVGREKEVINAFGMKVIPSEVEEVIAALPAVTEVKVYPGKHRSGSQIVKAAVAGEDSLSAATIRDHCTQELAPFKRPEVIHVIEKLPRSPLGKIVLDQLP